MTNFIIIAVLAVILGIAIRYIVKAKKSGKKCIGCPGNCGCSCSCSACTCAPDSKTDEN